MSINIKNLNYIYGENTPYCIQALKNINMSISDGEFVGIIGHTGSGKSTLIQHINRLLVPTSGEVLIDGIDINKKNYCVKEVRKKIGLVFQYPEHQLFEINVYNDIAFGPKNIGLPAEEIDIRVKESIRKVGISEEVLELSPFELSGGEKRRVAIAGVLAMNPSILILDEPTAGLDPRGRNLILGEIKKLHEENNLTVILISHSMDEIGEYVDRIIVMDKGEIKLDGTKKQVFREIDKLEKLGLAVPQITYLIRELKYRGIEIDEDITSVKEAYHIIEKLIKVGRIND